MLELLPCFYHYGDDFRAWKMSHLRFEMKSVSFTSEQESSADVTFIELRLESETIQIPASDIWYVETSPNPPLTIISLKLHDKVLVCLS